MKYCHLYLLGLMLLLTPSVFSDENSASPKLILSVKPHLCLRVSSRDHCEFSVTIVWHDSTIKDYCLHSILDKEPLRCWKNLKYASLVEYRRIDQDLIYWLSFPGEKDRLVTASIEIATLIDKDRRNQIKRRHIWNLI